MITENGTTDVQPQVMAADGALMITENGVIDAVERHLREAGFVAECKNSTRDKGVDLIMVNDGRRILFEAKGGTSSKRGSPRYGMPFSQSQVKDHVAVAFLAAARLLTSKESTEEVALAFPDNVNHRKEIRNAWRGFSMLGISLYLVGEYSLAVRVVSGESLAAL